MLSSLLVASNPFQEISNHVVRIQEIIIQSTQGTLFYPTSLLWSGLIVLVLFFLFKDRVSQIINPRQKMLLCYHVQSMALCGIGYFASETACSFFKAPLGLEKTWSLIWMGVSLFLVSAAFSVGLHILKHWQSHSVASHSSNLS